MYGKASASTQEAPTQYDVLKLQVLLEIMPKRKTFGLKLPFDALRKHLKLISESEFQRAKSIIENEKNKQGSDEYKRQAAALDPGVRTFQTVYDSSGNFFEAGKGDIRRVERLCLKLDRLISKATGVKT
ncbi:hypothetical protein MP638_003743, partial [Amoeboaphelidium occidentale]